MWRHLIAARMHYVPSLEVHVMKTYFFFSLCSLVKEFAELLTRRGIPLKQKGRVYRTCVQSVMVYASETWAVRVEEEQRMERNENGMIRWMCGVTLKDNIVRGGF